MVDDMQTPGELDDILTRAVDRQIAEQRALRQSLDELRDSVRELSTRPGARVDMSTVEDRLKGISSIEDSLKSISSIEQRLKGISSIEERLQTVARAVAEQPPAQNIDVAGLEERLRGAIQSTVLGASETTFASLSDQLRSLREVVVPRLEHAADTNETVQAISHDLAAIRDVVGGVSSDLEGIAQALIDFNSGLRSWAEGMDDSVSSIRQTVGELYAVATQPAPSRKKEEKEPGKPGDDSAAAEVGSPEGKAEGKAGEGDKPEAIVERIKVTAELSEYLADQIEDLDGLMGRLTELPVQLEGVVSQALKRTLTARAKLDREAETALDDVLEALDEHVNQLSGVLERFEQEEDHIRKMALEQLELSSRIESLQSTFVDRIDRIETQHRRGEEAIAIAIDRSARGLAPRALEGLSKSARRRKSTPARKAKATKAKSSGKRKTPASSAVRTAQTKRKAKRPSTRKSNKRLDWTPLPSDETPG